MGSCIVLIFCLWLSINLIMCSHLLSCKLIGSNYLSFIEKITWIHILWLYFGNRQWLISLLPISIILVVQKKDFLYWSIAYVFTSILSFDLVLKKVYLLHLVRRDFIKFCSILSFYLLHLVGRDFICELT